MAMTATTTSSSSSVKPRVAGRSLLPISVRKRPKSASKQILILRIFTGVVRVAWEGAASAAGAAAAGHVTGHLTACQAASSLDPAGLKYIIPSGQARYDQKDRPAHIAYTRQKQLRNSCCCSGGRAAGGRLHDSVNFYSPIAAQLDENFRNFRRNRNGLRFLSM